MRFSIGVNVCLALTTMFSFSLAQVPLDEDLFSTASFSTDSNLYFNNNDGQDSGTGASTLALNNVGHAADTNIEVDDLLLPASACGGENGNLNKKLRRRGGEGVDSFCLNGEEVPQKKKKVVSSFLRFSNRETPFWTGSNREPKLEVKNAFGLLILRIPVATVIKG